MKAEEVPAELVEVAKAAVREQVEGAPGHVSDRLAESIARHALAAVLPLAYAEAIEHVAKRISPYSGIGLAHGATRGDVAVWLLEYAASLRGTTTEGSGAP